jgi:type II secretory pathway pseudopilin PulG
MIKNSLGQKGSAHVIIIVILVVALVSALGYIFWQNYTSKNTQQASTAQVAASSGKQQSQSATPAGDRYETLEAWGVKFKLDDSIKDTGVVQYKRYDQASPPREYYVLNTASADKVWKETCPGMSSPTGDLLYRFTEKPSVDVEGQLLEADGILLNPASIDGYYYVWVRQGYVECSPNSQTIEPMDEAVNSSKVLLTSLRTLQSAE